MWYDQIAEHFPYRAVVKAPGWDRQITLPSQSVPLVKFFIMNYDKVSQRERIKRKWVHRWGDLILRFDPDILVLDESHRCKRGSSNRSRFLWRVVEKMRERRDNNDKRPHVYLLSGTPNPKGYIDLFAQFRIMDSTIFGTAKAAFEEQYCQYGFGRRRYTIIRYRNKVELLKRIRQNATTVSEARAGMIVPKVWQDLTVSLPPQARQKYVEMAEELITEVQNAESGEMEEITAVNAAVRRLRLLQITGGFTSSGGQIHDEKLVGLADFLGDLREQEQSVVIYCRFVPETIACRRIAARCGFDAADIRGETTDRDRTAAITRFQSEANPMALVFQIQAGAISIELSAAREVIFYSLPDSWDDYYQALQRVGGPKQNHTIRITHIVAKNTLDRRVAHALRDKADMHGELLRAPRAFLFGA